MTKKIYVYSTGRNKTSDITRTFAHGINQSLLDYKAEYVDIQKYLDNGIPDDADGIAVLGILRGTGLAIKEAKQKKIDYYYIDHAYFNPGYADPCWLRVTKNSHTMNYFTKEPIDSSRYKKHFSTQNPIKKWRPRDYRGNNILILPPTHAVKWFFDDYHWEARIVDRLKTMLPTNEWNRIVIRTKPNEPIVDKLGNLIRIQESKSPSTLDHDLENAFVVIGYNSMVCLQSSLKGIPVITSPNSCCYPISFKLEDFAQSSYPFEYNNPPDVQQLVNWLSYCQFSLKDFRSGKAWNFIQRYQYGI